jgi:hypothetical protein
MRFAFGESMWVSLWKDVLDRAELQYLLTRDDATFREAAMALYRMNKAGRVGFGSYTDVEVLPRQHVQLHVLVAAQGNLDGLFIYLRDCPSLFALRK